MVLTLYLGVFVDCRIFPLKDIYCEKSLNTALKLFSEGRNKEKFISCCLPQHNELSILHWHFGGGGGGDVFLLRGVHWAQLTWEVRKDEWDSMGWVRKGQGGQRKGWTPIDWSTRGEEKMKGEGSAEPQLHPFMPHVPAFRSTACPALQSDKEKDEMQKLDFFFHKVT